MYGLEGCEHHSYSCAGRQPGTEAECSPDNPTRVAAPFGLITAGHPWTIPRLERIPTEYQFVGGIDIAAKLAKTLALTGLANPTDWVQVGRDPFRFVEHALKNYVEAHGGPEIKKEFFLRLGLVSDLDPYGNGGEDAGVEGEMFLALEPDSAGYVVLGPALRLLETVHPRLPVTFIHLFTGALNPWVRVYDHRDALERVEQLREWYQADPDGETAELPAVDAAIPACLRKKWNPLKEPFVEQLAGRVRNRRVRALLEGVLELSRISLTGKRPNIGETAEARLMDSNPPVPALVAVFNKHDAVEGCFHEECQGMLECTPEPNVILPLLAEDGDSVREAFRLLGVVCDVLRQGARLITKMMELVE